MVVPGLISWLCAWLAMMQTHSLLESRSNQHDGASRSIMDDGHSHSYSEVKHFQLSASDGGEHATDSELRDVSNALFGMNERSLEEWEVNRAPYGEWLRLSLNIGGAIDRDYGQVELQLDDSLLHDKAEAFHSAASGEALAAQNVAYRGLLVEKESGQTVGWVRAAVVDLDEAHVFIFNFFENELTILEPTAQVRHHSPAP